MNVRYDMIAVHTVRPALSGQGYDFLQLRRQSGDYLGGTWQIVRGSIEPGEKAWQAALRELREETSLVPLEFYKLSLMEQFYLAQTETVWHVPCFVAVVDCEAPVVLNREHDAFRWVEHERIDSETYWAGERLVLAEVFREVLENGKSKASIRLDFT